MSSAWWKVARGAAQVAHHWSTQHALHGEKAAVRAAQHGMDLSGKAYDSLGASLQQAETFMKMMQQQQQQQQHYDSSPPPIHHNAPTHPPSYADPNVTQPEPSSDISPPDAHKAPSIDQAPSSSEPNPQTLTQSLNSESTSGTATAAPPQTPSDYHAAEGEAVPSTRIARAWGFARLGMSLAWGTARKGASRIVGGGGGGGGGNDSNQDQSIFVHSDNADQVAATLCRMRGAALKLGQMLSIQDASLLPPALHRALAQVRQGSTAMPTAQLRQQLSSQLGEKWRDLFLEFDERPMAAASIGQVHRATTRDSRPVVVKVQFPGVAQSITSDLKNLGMLVKWSNLAPKGLFLDNIIRVGQTELSVECDYERELANQQKIKRLVESDEFLQREKFVVPDVVPGLSTAQVLTSEFMPGGTIDKVSNVSVAERNRIGRAILYLTMQELFVWRFMQTDPNWGNFLYDTGTQQTALIDFGATRDYSKEFVDGYIRIVWAAANRDENTLMDQSHRMGFLTGEENDEMKRAHLLSGFTVGEPFQQSEPFDFKASRISSRMGEHTAVFLRHRLTAPPTEVYTLHRKLAGAYMLCIQLGAVVSSRDLLETIVRNHHFEDGLPHPMDI